MWFGVDVETDGFWGVKGSDARVERFEGEFGEVREEG